MTEQRRQRHVRSFVRRQGRLTKGQQRAYGDMWPLVGVDLPDQAERLRDMAGLFGREAQRTLEIGFGNGDTLADMAQAMPERDFIGVEVHRPGVGHLCMRIQDGEISNLRVLCHDAVELVRDYLPAQSLDAVHIYFPDPWHKTRHHKRRIVNPKFVDLLAKLVRPGGYLHLATDWRGYATHMLKVMEAAEGWQNSQAEGGYSPRPEWRPETKFERRGLKLGHGVWDLVYRRIQLVA